MREARKLLSFRKIGDTSFSTVRNNLELSFLCLQIVQCYKYAKSIINMVFISSSRSKPDVTPTLLSELTF